MSALGSKAVVLTGASSGIGRALAESLASQGAQLVLAARSRDALEEVRASCVKRGAAAIAVPTDVTDPAQCEALMARAVEAFGGIDVLVANAGVSMWARFDEIEDLTLFDRLMKVNYLGAVYATHFALPHVRARRGLLVGVSSLAGKTGVPCRTGYAASKHAMQGFFDSLRIEVRHTGVDVLVVSPGFVATPIRERALGPKGRPLEVSPHDERGATMSVEECVALMVRAIERRDRELVMTRQAKLGMWVRLVAPKIVDGIAARAMRDHGGKR